MNLIMKCLCLTLLSSLPLAAKEYVPPKKFPFQAVWTGEQIKGFQFWDMLSISEKGDEQLEVMVIAEDGFVFFPAEVAFSMPHLKSFYKKLIEPIKILDEKAIISKVTKLAQLITPWSHDPMIVYPSIQENKVSAYAFYWGMKEQEVILKAKEWHEKTKAKINKKLKPNT